jgi:hypothetical protein
MSGMSMSLKGSSLFNIISAVIVDAIQSI